MEKNITNSLKSEESKPTVQEQAMSDKSNVDTDALNEVTSSFTAFSDNRGKAKLSRKEKRLCKHELKKNQKTAKAKVSEQKRKNKSVRSKLKERDKELSKKTNEQRLKRKNAKDTLSYLGYERMYQDGICQVEDGLYSSSLSFSDTSYHSIREDMQKGVFSSMCRLYDQFGADTLVQLNVINTPLLKEEIGTRQFFSVEDQSTANSREDAEVFNQILNDKIKQGISNIKRDRYITYTVSADTADAAVPKLTRIENETSRILNSVGSKVKLLDGTDRLRILHSQLKPMKPFDFSYERDISSLYAQTTKDIISPTNFDTKPDGHGDCFKTGDTWGQVLVIRSFGADMSDRVLSDIANLSIPLNMTWFVQPMDKAKAVSFVRQRSAWIDKEIIDEQRSAVNKGYDFSILPAELKRSKDETKDVLDHLQNKNQRLYVFTGLAYTYAKSKEELDTQVLDIISAARQNSIEIDTLDYRQREGLNSVLPLGHNHINISRMLTTAQVAILMPFATQEIDDVGGNYYGQNKQSNNLVVCNRKLLASPMGFISGKTGSGKGMFAKTEMEGTILSNPDDEIFVIDRAGEYPAIIKRHGGEEYKFAVGSKTYLNPLDTISVSEKSYEEQIAFKVDAMLAQAAASAAESGQHLSQVDQSIITRCVELAYRRRSKDNQNKPPILNDFYRILLEQKEPEAKVIALRYERFVKGTMSFFNHHTTVNFANRLNDINLKELPDSMLVFALITVCEAIRNRMYSNHAKGIRTWLYVEEIQSMFRYPTVLNYFSRFANEGRKYGLLLTGITQNSVAMLENEAARNIVLNADFIMLLKQSPVDRKQWVNLLSLSEQEEECIDESTEAGDGLLIAGNARIGIRGKMPDGNILYDIFSTNPNELEEKKRAEKYRKNEYNRHKKHKGKKPQNRHNEKKVNENAES